MYTLDSELLINLKFSGLFLIIGYHRPVPEYIGNMTSLVRLSLETNQFNGSLPPEIGEAGQFRDAQSHC
ncbi:hypothetical protein HAX54_050118 [Datura stramonium]|uniref:Uncharacterized protein n=1 Tax=Datura stramonium TaxID=4076 RepID=A0ABS8WQU9_DATST|nr:hypothetical protein [Datura stramonium]